jgi:hypothetical protein
MIRIQAVAYSLQGVNQKMIRMTLIHKVHRQLFASYIGQGQTQAQALYISSPHMGRTNIHFVMSLV